MSTNNIFSYSQMEVHKKKYPRHHQVNNEWDAEENGEEPSVMRLNINDAVGIANSALNRGYVNTGGWHAAGPITPAFSTSDTELETRISTTTTTTPTHRCEVYGDIRGVV